jgi:hypothetical protein
MLRRAIVPVFLGATMLVASAAIPAVKSPAWLSIESPVSPYNPTERGALFLVHATLPGSIPEMSSLTGSAEGLVNGVRKSVAIRFDATNRPGTFAVRKQWDGDGAWLVRVSLLTTTAIVTFDRNGDVASARVPALPGSGTLLPRPVAPREIDSVLAELAKR